MGRYIQSTSKASGRRGSARFLAVSSTAAVAERGEDGRFMKAALPSEAVVVVLTRQQKRFNERQLVKKGREALAQGKSIEEVGQLVLDAVARGEVE